VKCVGRRTLATDNPTHVVAQFNERHKHMRFKRSRFKRYRFSRETHLKPTERHLQYEITQPTQENTTCLNPSHTGGYSIYICGGWKAELTLMLVIYRDD